MLRIVEVKCRDLVYIFAKSGCPFVTVPGGERPSGPPSVFDGIPKSCLKQIKSNPRKTKLASSETRGIKEEATKKKKTRFQDLRHLFMNFLRNFEGTKLMI